MKIVAVGGFASNVGKTTLVCRMLECLPGWEAVKVTKGHYRSCGKDPHACCVSHLLSDAPLVISDRKQTDVPGKDTGRFWQAGASNVHWVIAVKDQVADGVRQALGRVAPGCPGVIVEGTGFAAQIPVDSLVLVATESQREIKSSTVSVFPRARALFVAGFDPEDPTPLDRVAELLRRRGVSASMPPVFSSRDLTKLVETVTAN